jgi:hypothetical protein
MYNSIDLVMSETGMAGNEKKSAESRVFLL